MPPKTPAFWQERTSPLSLFLSPLSWLYACAISLKLRFANPYKSKLPVLCVGGIVAGGSGKTPIVSALVELLERKGLFHRPVILTRGYGGRLKGPTLVDITRHEAMDVGDEALLHARLAPVIVARDRAAGAKLAEAMGADIIIMDDGFQNTALSKDFSLIVIDATYGLGNGRLLPAGPLRECMKTALNRAQCVVYTNGHLSVQGEKPSMTTSLSISAHPDRSKSYIAFAGIGRPEKFFDTLRREGYSLSRCIAFPDHHPYTDKDLMNLSATGESLITTEKDFVRLPEDFRHKVSVLPIVLSFDDEECLLSLLRDKLGAA